MARQLDSGPPPVPPKRVPHIFHPPSKEQQRRRKDSRTHTTEDWVPLKLEVVGTPPGVPPSPGEDENSLVLAKDNPVTLSRIRDSAFARDSISITTEDTLCVDVKTAFVKDKCVIERPERRPLQTIKTISSSSGGCREAKNYINTAKHDSGFEECQTPKSDQVFNISGIHLDDGDNDIDDNVTSELPRPKSDRSNSLPVNLYGKPPKPSLIKQHSLPNTKIDHKEMWTPMFQSKKLDSVSESIPSEEDLTVGEDYEIPGATEERDDLYVTPNQDINGGRDTSEQSGCTGSSNELQ